MRSIDETGRNCVSFGEGDLNTNKSTNRRFQKNNKSIKLSTRYAIDIVQEHDQVVNLLFRFFLQSFVEHWNSDRIVILDVTYP